jgi:flagellar protein FliO/FliZ
MSRFKEALWALPLLALSVGVMAADPATSAAAPAVTPAVATTTPAATAAAPAVSSAMSSGIGGQLLQLVLGLGLVVALIFVLAWLMRRVQRAGPAGNQVIELLGSRALGPRDRLVLVQVGTEQILLGVTPGRITPLHVMNEPVHVPETQATTPEFARRLMEALGNKGIGNRSASDTGAGDNKVQKDKN